MNQLAKLWSEWISLRLAASECNWGDARFSQPSKVNAPTYGPVDDTLVDKLCSRVEASHPDTWPPALERSHKYVHSALKINDGARLLKGKWVANYLIHLTRQEYGRDRKLPSVSGAQLMSACSMSVDFESAWSWYGPKLQPLLSR